MALAGRATSTIELGTSVLQTYTVPSRAPGHQSGRHRGGDRRTGSVHPRRRPIAPSGDRGHVRPELRHTRPPHRGVRRDPHDAAARRARPPLRRGVPRHRRTTRPGRRRGSRPRQRARAPAPAGGGPARRRHDHVDGQRHGDRDHVAPRIRRAATDAGRPDPASSSGSRSPCTTTSRRPATSPPNASRSTARSPTTSGSWTTAERTAPPTPRSSETRTGSPQQVEALFDAGATDVWAAIFPVGSDASASRARTRALLRELATG